MKTPFLLLALPLSLSAQTLNVYPTGPVAPRGTYQTVTAQTQGVNDKTVTWTTDGGTIVGTNPCVVNEPCTVALYDTTAGTYHLTATSNANHSVTAVSTITFTASPTPATGHPRLGGMTVANLAALQAKAVSGNTFYNSGPYPYAVSLYTTANAQWNWSCGGGPSNTKTGQPAADQSASYSIGANYETYWYFFAYMADVDPSDATYNWKCYAHDIGQYYENYWLSPDNSLYTTPTLPYRQVDENYGLTGNHGSDNTTYMTLSPDWSIGGGAAGAGSGATLSATLTGGTMNTPTITAGGSGYLANSTVYWWAPVGSSGCAVQGHRGNYESSSFGNNGTPFAAMGVAQTNGSGVVAGTVTTLANATGCTSAPAITVYTDQQTTRDYLAMAAAMMIKIRYTGSVAPVGTYNSSAMFDTGDPLDFTTQRAMGNNYTFSKDMYLTASALTFDDNTTDDPALPNTCSATRYQVCPDGSAGSLHAYWTYLDGGMLYKEWAHLEDPNVSWQAYQATYANLPTKPMCDDIVSTTTSVPRVPCFGDGRGGEGSEGVSYNYSFYRLAEAIASIHSAGYDDPILYGPQISLDTSSFWDLHLNSDLGFISYTSVAAQPRFSSFFVGDIFNFPNPSTFEDAAWLMAYDASTGRTDRTAVEKWSLVGTSVGGVSDFYTNLHSYATENNIPMFIALPSGDPSSPAPTDPRSTLPTVAYAANNQSIFARSAWVTNGPESPSDTGSPTPTTQQVFFTHCPNTRIDHEQGDCGRFDILSNGEYITKGRAIDPEYHYYLSSAEHANLFGLAANQSQTTFCTVSTGYFTGPACQGMDQWSAQSYTNGSIAFNGSGYWKCTGTPCSGADVPGTAGDWASISYNQTKGAGQLFHGLQAGNATLNHSEMPNYIAFDVDDTPLYSGSAETSIGLGTVNGVTAASRSLVYLRGSKQIVYYDREAGAQFSRDWMNTTGTISIAGSTASWLTQSGTQKTYFTKLLPTSGVTMSDAGGWLTLANGNPSSTDWEAVSHVLEDLGSPATAQVLNVLEWGASGFTKSTTMAVQSSAGQNFDGALVGSSVVMFMRSWPGSFTSTTYPASGATTQYVSDLAPNTSYGVTGAGTPSTVTTDNAGVATFAATGTGNITVGATAAPSQLQGVVCIGCTVQ